MVGDGNLLAAGAGRAISCGSVDMRLRFCRSLSAMKNVFLYFGMDDIVNIARLLLSFSKLSKTEIKQFTTGMNHYLIASPSARREMKEIWANASNSPEENNARSREKIIEQVERIEGS